MQLTAKARPSDIKAVVTAAVAVERERCRKEIRRLRAALKALLDDINRWGSKPISQEVVNDARAALRGSQQEPTNGR